MIRLMKSTFYKEEEIKEKLCDFIKKSEKLSMGEKCKEFEESFSQYQGRKYSVLFNSGSSANLALIQALLNLRKLSKGDVIGFSSLTWSTNVTPLIQLGLDPLPIDVSLRHLNISSETLLQTLEKKPFKALFLTHLLGFCGDINKIKEICANKNIILLEDNCESLGSELQGKKLGNFGLASTFSSFVGHHISTIEGGMVCTDDKKLYEMLLMVRGHGWNRDLDTSRQEELRKKYNIDRFFDRYTFYVLAYNLRPTEITGFLGLEQLKYIEEIIRKRKENFEEFDKIIKDNPDFLDINTSHMNYISNFSYPLLFNNEETFNKYKKLFIGTVEIRPIVGGYIVEQPFFKEYMQEKGLSYECPNAKKINKLGFYFPNNAELTREEINYLCELLKGKLPSKNNITNS